MGADGGVDPFHVTGAVVPITMNVVSVPSVTTIMWACFPALFVPVPILVVMSGLLRPLAFVTYTFLPRLASGFGVRSTPAGLGVLRLGWGEASWPGASRKLLRFSGIWPAFSDSERFSFIPAGRSDAALLRPCLSGVAIPSMEVVL